MRETQQHDPGLRRDHLEALSQELAPRGFDVELGASRTGVPLLNVNNSTRPGPLCEDVACVAGLDGRLYYAWAWGSHLAETGDVDMAAAEVMRVLGGGHG